MSSRVQVDLGSPYVPWTREDTRRIIAAMRARVVERSRREHVGADGRPYRDADGQPTDWTDTGAMLDTLATREGRDGAEVVPTVPYAAEVDARRPWLGMPPAEVDARIMPEVTRAINKHIAAANRSRRVAIHG